MLAEIVAHLLQLGVISTKDPLLVEEELTYTLKHAPTEIYRTLMNLDELTLHESPARIEARIWTILNR